MSELISHYERRLFRLFIFIVQPVGNNMLNIGYRTEDIRFNYYIFFFIIIFPLFCVCFSVSRFARNQFRQRSASKGSSCLACDIAASVNIFFIIYRFLHPCDICARIYLYKDINIDYKI